MEAMEFLVDLLVLRLNDVRWRTYKRITPKANKLIQEHLARMRKVIAFLGESKGMLPDDAHGFAQAAGSESRLYEIVLDKLFKEVIFIRSGVREPIIFAITACYGWDYDPDLAHLPNPWFPLLQLCLLGYPISSDSSLDSKSVSLVVGLRDSLREFKIV